MTPDNELDSGQMITEVLDGVAALAEGDDSLGAELAGATMLATVSAAGDDLVPVVVQQLIPQVEGRPGPGALALLMAVSSVASGTHDEVATAAAGAAERLAAMGVPKPRWAAELAEPLRTGDRLWLQDPGETLSLLVGSFQRAGRGHAFIVTVDHQECGAAADIFFVHADQLPEVLEGIAEDGLVVRTHGLDPAEFRWYVEDALDARAVHDEEDPLDAHFALLGDADPDPEDAGPADLFEEDGDEGPPYEVMAALVRARLTTLPRPRRPAGVRGHHETATEAAAAVRGRPPVHAAGPTRQT
ncbi:hypothetical protein [Phytohabitans suffuscus]|uniref:Uncharacterized protein n=1 Tax=Phytohabitans suffuscus TaxID=624315 RepID=A0A6F8YKM5_9ACTN|nr:hypothetical protein [Phytohabitans suffuscus]BCB86627.1 hypothetical protein Psuf_039400 [Phytohabitans suffuscus]